MPVLCHDFLMRSNRGMSTAASFGLFVMAQLLKRSIVATALTINIAAVWEMHDVDSQLLMQ